MTPISNTESGFEDADRNDRKNNEPESMPVTNFVDEIDTNLVTVDENEEQNIRSRKILAKKIETGDGDYNVVYDVINQNVIY